MKIKLSDTDWKCRFDVPTNKWVIEISNPQALELLELKYGYRIKDVSLEIEAEGEEE